jgi:hypothetical protein
MNSTLEQRIQTFVQLGQALQLFSEKREWPGYACGLTEEEFNGVNDVIESAYTFNGWFTAANVRQALSALANELTLEKLTAWTAGLSFPADPKTVAIICAGNIPAVAFHDILSVLISGNKTIIKLSSDDPILIPALLKIAGKFEVDFDLNYSFSRGKLENFEAVIATGSNSTAVHFHNYFGKYPHIIRQNRNSVAILDGSETPDQLEKLGHDLFDYFGLGCRNVTKLYLPVDFDLDRIFNGIFSFQSIATHNKYANNYDYNKAVWLLNNEDLLENGFVIFKEDKNIASPVASVFYERYENKEALLQHLDNHADQIQCIVGNEFIPFGKSQCPALNDYADNVNTLEFLNSLNA